MTNPYHKILEDPDFIELVETRRRLTLRLSLIMLVIYFSFILTIAFKPHILGTPIGDGPTSLGIVIGIAIILTAFALTGIYIKISNSTFDALTHKARQHLIKKEG